MDSTHNRLHNIRHSNHSRQQQCQQLRQWFIISSRRYRSGCYCISWEIWKVFCDFMRIFLCITIVTDSELSQVFSSRINKNVKKGWGQNSATLLKQAWSVTQEICSGQSECRIHFIFAIWAFLPPIDICVFYFFVITSAIWCGTHNRVGLQFKCLCR